jgi:hypothetical protein
MDAKNSTTAIRLVPSFTDFAFLMPIVFLFGRMEGMQTLLGDCDTGWHIRTGQWILAHHRVPLHDLFSYAKPGGVWYAWEWLADIMLAGVYGLGGLRAVAISAILILSITFTLLYLMARKKSNAVFAILATMAGAAASSIHWLARPHLFTLLFLVVFYVVLERTREGSRWMLWLLLPATTIWTNLHGGFFVGIAMAGAYGMGEILPIVLSADRSGWQLRLRRAAEYFATAAGCLLASLVNPYTYHLHVHVIEFLGDSYQSQHIMEFMSLSFHHPLAMFFEFILLCGALASAWYISQGRYTEPLLYLVWAHGALLASRNIPISMIITVPMVAEVMQMAFQRLPECHVAEWIRRSARQLNGVVAEMCETDGIARWHVVSAAGVAVVVALLWAPNPPKRFRAEFDPHAFPSAAIPTLANIPSARIFTYDQWGDYLIYRLYPRGGRVFTDGRFDYYGEEFVKKVAGVVGVSYGWEKTLAEFGVNTILMPPSSPLTGALKESSKWHVVYDDGISLVFRQTPGGETVSATSTEGRSSHSDGTGPGGSGRGREVTKTQAGDQLNQRTKSKT